LTTFGRSYCDIYISLNIKELTPAFYGQFMRRKVVTVTGFANYTSKIATEKYNKQIMLK